MGRSIGKEVPVKPPLKKIGIYLHWVDGIGECSKGFDTVQGFAEFLKANPILAEGVGYVAKKNTKAN